MAGSLQERSVRQDLASRGMELPCAICDVFVLVIVAGSDDDMLPSYPSCKTFTCYP